LHASKGHESGGEMTEKTRVRITVEKRFAHRMKVQAGMRVASEN